MVDARGEFQTALADDWRPHMQGGVGVFPIGKRQCGPSLNRCHKDPLSRGSIALDARRVGAEEYLRAVSTGSADAASSVLGWGRSASCGGVKRKKGYATRGVFW